MNNLSDDELRAQQNNEENTKLRYITPIIQERWQDIDKIVMEYYFTDGRINIDEYNEAHRGKAKKVDYLLLYKDNILLALVEAKGRLHSAGEGYEQAVEYARLLDVPFAYATNGIELIEKDMISGINRTLCIDNFPTSEELWERYIKEKCLNDEEEAIVSYPYYTDTLGKKPRYYQRIAINRAVEAIARGQKRLLLVMATGTGKTYTAFQIIYRLWKTKSKKKILFLADRNILVDQTIRKDFKPFGDAMIKFDNNNINTSKDIYLSLYHQLKSNHKNYYKKFPRDFFDLIVIDECHRSSASADSSWHEILTYFSSAVQIGLTATPKDGGIDEAYKAEQEAKDVYDWHKIHKSRKEEIEKAKKEYEKLLYKRMKVEEESNVNYFGNPIYTYSLKQGIEDGFLAPYKVLAVELDIDKFGWRPSPDMTDVNGYPIEQRLYTQPEFDRKIVVKERRELVAKRISDFLKTNNMRYAKTIVFCEDIPHCQEMVRLLENENADLVAEDSRYIMQITGDNEIGKAQLDNFTDPYSKYPVIAVTSRLMSTGVDAETCEVVVLDRTIGSMTEFKQIIGRGTRVKQSYVIDGVEKSKMYFSILDFRNNYLKFQDPAFDGEAITIVDVPETDKFPKTPKPLKPLKPPKTPKPPMIDRVVRVKGVDVNIIGEEVQYIDPEGNLVKQNIISCIRNNVLSQYPAYEDFKAAWLLSKDKDHFAYRLLLGNYWEEYYRIRYGYNIDAYDIIGHIAYDIEPHISKYQRIQSSAVERYIAVMPIEKKIIIQKLLHAYVKTSFKNLTDIANIFSQKEFTDMGYTPLKIIKQIFGTKEKYFKMLRELENKLYE